MNAKTAIGRIIGKGGLKSGNCRADSGLQKGKQESAAPRKSMEEAATGKGTDPERSGVLQVSRALPEPSRPCPADTALSLGSRSHSFPPKTFDVTTGLVVRQFRQTFSFTLSF